jgi:hypothetical protein
MEGPTLSLTTDLFIQLCILLDWAASLFYFFRGKWVFVRTEEAGGLHVHSYLILISSLALQKVLVSPQIWRVHGERFYF